MQEASSRVQSVFMPNNNIRPHLKLIDDVRICGSFFTGFDFFLVFDQARRRGQFFMALYKLKLHWLSSFQARS